MKKAVVMFIAFVFAAQVGGTLFAGEKEGCACCGKDGKQCSMKQHQGKRQGKRFERLASELNLTPEQKEKVSAILKENADKAKAEAQRSRQAVAAIREETDRQIAAVLTSEQAQKYEKLQAGRKAKKGKKSLHEDEKK